MAATGVQMLLGAFLVLGTYLPCSLSAPYGVYFDPPRRGFEVVLPSQVLPSQPQRLMPQVWRPSPPQSDPAPIVTKTVYVFVDDAGGRGDQQLLHSLPDLLQLIAGGEGGGSGVFGGHPGGQHGGHPGGQHGGYPGGQHGGQYGGYPGGQHGDYPGGQLGGHPGGQHGGPGLPFPVPPPPPPSRNEVTEQPPLREEFLDIEDPEVKQQPSWNQDEDDVPATPSPSPSPASAPDASVETPNSTDSPLEYPAEDQNDDQANNPPIDIRSGFAGVAPRRVRPQS